MNSVSLGEQYQTRASFVLPINPPSGSFCTWEVLDADASIYGTGTTNSLSSTQSQVRGNEFLIQCDATILIPAELPVSANGTDYTIRFTLNLPSGDKLFYQEKVLVNPRTYTRQGAMPSVDIAGDNVRVYATLDAAYTDIQLNVYKLNATYRSIPSVPPAIPSADGFTVQADFPTAPTDASMEPYTLLWKYRQAGNPIWQTTTGNLYLVNPSLLEGYNQVIQFLNKAYIDSGVNPGTEFDPAAIFTYLRMGADMFNAAVLPTQFTMLAAQSGCRQFWMLYSMAYAARSQYIAEGMKAFNYGGQIVNIDVDRTPFWESLASSLEAQAESQVRPFKLNLANAGITAGDGSNAMLAAINVGAIGLSIHNSSNFRSTFIAGGNSIRF